MALVSFKTASFVSPRLVKYPSCISSLSLFLVIFVLHKNYGYPTVQNNGKNPGQVSSFGYGGDHSSITSKNNTTPFLYWIRYGSKSSRLKCLRPCFSGLSFQGIR